MGIIDQISNLSLEEDEIQTHGILIVQNKEKTLEAKLKQLHQRKSKKFYEEIPNQNQNCISLRWVIKEKLVDNEKFIKARLCARDFDEEQNFRTDSEMHSTEGLRLTCSMIASNKWTLNSLDVKTAF